MNLKDLHTADKPLQTKKMFSATDGVLSIKINAGGRRCATRNGRRQFENEKGAINTIMPGDYVNIETNVKHWVTAKKDSNLLLTK